MRYVFATIIALAGPSAGTAIAAALPVAEAIQTVQTEGPRRFAQLRENLHLPHACVGTSVAELMAVSDEPVELSGDRTLISGCRPNSCNEKAAASIGPDRSLQAVALRHFNCRRSLTESIPEVLCDRQATLLVYLIYSSNAPAPPSSDALLLKQLERWAHQAGYAREEVRPIQRTTIDQEIACLIPRS